MSSSASDEELLEQFGKGDESAFETIFHRYFDDIVRYLFQRVAKQEIAEDLAQHVFVRLFERHGGIKTSLKGWLKTVARNLAHDHFRAGGKLTAFGKSQLQETPVQHPVEPVISKELENFVRAVFQSGKIKDTAREILRLRIVEGKSVSEVMETLKLTKDQVCVTLTRVLKRLHDLVKEAGFDSGDLP